MRRATDKFDSAIRLLGLCVICTAVMAGGLLYVALVVEVAR